MLNLQIKKMFVCKYCGKFTISFSSSHKDCRERHKQTLVELNNILRPENLFAENSNAEEVAHKIETLCTNGLISETEKHKVVADGLMNALLYSMEDHILSEDEEKILVGLMNTFASNPAVEKMYSVFKENLRKADILHKLKTGKIDQLPAVSDPLPFLLQKNEQIFIASQNVDYFETKIKTTYKGATQGVSIRITKGVYYRVGAFRGHPVKTEQQEFVGRGTLALSNRHIYFHSHTKSLKIPYTKIVTLESYEDGLTLMRDGTTARPQTFKGVDGWFYSNAINLIIANT